MDLTEQVLQTSTSYQGQILKIEKQTVELADGRQAQREIVRHQPAVAILAITEANKLVLVKQWRSPVAGPLLEVPAGKIEAGESPLEAAKRELNEETRLQSEKLTPVTTFYTSPGFTDEKMTLFQASNIQAVENALPQDNDENIQLVYLDGTAANRAVADGQIQDAKTIMAIWYWQLQLRRSTNG